MDKTEVFVNKLLVTLAWMNDKGTLHRGWGQLGPSEDKEFYYKMQELFIKLEELKNEL